MSTYFRKSYLVLVVVAVLALAVAGCAEDAGHSHDKPESQEHSHEMETGSPKAAPVSTNEKVGSKRVTVEVRGGKFSPESINIEAGTKVLWVNSDTKSHEIHSDDDAFKSGELKPGEEFSVTFDGPAHVMYHCHLHETEHGMIMVGP